jgi:hypothetical protein
MPMRMELIAPRYGSGSGRFSFGMLLLPPGWRADGGERDTGR